MSPRTRRWCPWAGWPWPSCCGPAVTKQPAHERGFQLSEEPEVWIAYEQSVLLAELHRITNFIAGIVAPHARLVLNQFGGVKATLDILTRMERSS